MSKWCFGFVGFKVKLSGKRISIKCTKGIYVVTDLFILRDANMYLRAKVRRGIIIIEDYEFDKKNNNIIKRVQYDA